MKVGVWLVMIKSYKQNICHPSATHCHVYGLKHHYGKLAQPNVLIMRNIWRSLSNQNQ